MNLTADKLGFETRFQFRSSSNNEYSIKYLQMIKDFLYLLLLLAIYKSLRQADKNNNNNNNN